MAGSGGKRSGAGRKRGVRNKETVLKEQTLHRAMDLVAKKRSGYKELIEALWQVAVGVEVMKVDREGKEIVFSQPPDPLAAKTLLEFRFGKAPQSTTLTAEGEIVFRVQYDDKPNREEV